ncbi:MAG TPA: SAM-dependent methyltransferase [Candidatus Dormibacteraeota bacterium]|nr:SAM-dependent methyltransferase [Candidatus Dormibacteraeota bacterium]
MATSRQSASSPLTALLIRRIRAHGPISFAEYMRECLYHPLYGYYSRAQAKRFVDYYTSVDVHPIFGRLLARQLEEMWRILAKPQPFCVVEAGAGTGQLARNILDFAARELPNFYHALNYIAVERSAARRAIQETILAAHWTAGCCESAAEMPHEIPVGCVLSNELVDALPVHRVMFRNNALQEILVGVEGEHLCELSGPLTTCAIREYFATQAISLGDEQQAEASLEACDWIVEVGRRLGCGFVLTIDYGHEAAELYSQGHFRGTLLAYREHQVSEDFLAAPGEQDLTAHANFTALEEWGKRSGLVRIGLVPQSRFLMALGKGNQFADLYDQGRDRDESETEKIRGRLLLKTLIFPEGMGETFKVMVQHKGVAQPVLRGLSSL